MTKRLLALVVGMMIGGSVAAGSMAEDPHHGLKAGGCASKAKVAEMKKKHGENWAKQTPNAEIAEKAKQNRTKITNLDRFI